MAMLDALPHSTGVKQFKSQAAATQSSTHIKSFLLNSRKSIFCIQSVTGKIKIKINTNKTQPLKTTDSRQRANMKVRLMGEEEQLPREQGNHSWREKGRERDGAP